MKKWQENQLILVEAYSEKEVRGGEITRTPTLPHLSSDVVPQFKYQVIRCDILQHSN